MLYIYSLGGEEFTCENLTLYVIYLYVGSRGKERTALCSKVNQVGAIVHVAAPTSP